MRRVVIESDGVAPLFQDPAPDHRRPGYVVAARPLVTTEQHRAVLDGDLDPGVAREPDDRRPDLERDFPVLVLGLRRVTAHERVHERHAHGTRRGDDVLQMTDDLRAMLRVRMKWIRVEPETGDAEALRADLRDELRCPRLRQVRDVDVGGPGIAARRAGRSGPAGDLDRLEPVGRGPVGDLHEGRVRERSGEQAEPHRATSVGRAATGDPADLSTSTQRASRALRAIASLTSISSWPAANVAYGGSALGRPATTSA